VTQVSNNREDNGNRDALPDPDNDDGYSCDEGNGKLNVPPVIKVSHAPDIDKA
jgi:hypothetical protein